MTEEQSRMAQMMANQSAAQQDAQGQLGGQAFEAKDTPLRDDPMFRELFARRWRGVGARVEPEPVRQPTEEELRLWRDIDAPAIVEAARHLDRVSQEGHAARLTRDAVRRRFQAMWLVRAARFVIGAPAAIIAACRRLWSETLTVPWTSAPPKVKGPPKRLSGRRPWVGP